MIPPEVELCVVEIPGRIYLPDLPAKDMDELVSRVYPQIVENLDKPYILFGYSFGSVIAYEVAKKLQEEGKKLPDHLFVAARRGPHVPDRNPPTFELSDADFQDAMQNQYKAIPQEVIQHKELLERLLPILKEDIRINETYRVPLDRQLDIPVTIYYGSKDTSYIPEDVEKWKEVTNKEFNSKMFEGEHFFINQAKNTVISEVISAFR